MSENVTWKQSMFSPYVTLCHYFATYSVIGYSCKQIALSAYSTCMLLFQVTLFTMLRYEDRKAGIKEK